MRYYITIATLLLLVVSGARSQAQNPPDDWSLLLLDSQSQTLMQLRANTELQQYPIPVPSGYRIWRSGAASQNSTRFAYCMLNSNDLNQSGDEQSRIQTGVYDLTTRQTVFVRDVGRGIHCDVAVRNDGRLAVSHGAGCFQPAGSNTWQVTVLDRAGNTLNTLQHSAMVSGDDVYLPAFRADGLNVLIWERANHGRLIRWSPKTGIVTTLARQVAAPYTAYLPQTGEQIIPRRRYVLPRIYPGKYRQ